LRFLFLIKMIIFTKKNENVYMIVFIAKTGKYQ